MYILNSQFMFEMMSLCLLAGCTSPQDMSSNSPQFVLQNGSNFNSLVPLVTEDCDTPTCWATRRDDFVGLVSSRWPISYNISSVRTRLTHVRFLPNTNPVVQNLIVNRCFRRLWRISEWLTKVCYNFSFIIDTLLPSKCTVNSCTLTVWTCSCT